MLSWLDPAVAVVTAAVPVLLAVIGLIRYRMWLRFLREVFERAGDRRDLEVAGRIAQHVPRTHRRRRGPRMSECPP